MATPQNRRKQGTSTTTGRLRKDVSEGRRPARGQNRVEEAGPGGSVVGVAGRPPHLRLARRPGGSRGVSSRPREEARIRQLMNETFLKSRPEAEAALAKCFADPKTVLTCLELVARLDGELP